MPKNWTLLAKVDGGNSYFDRGAWEMLRAQVSGARVVPAQVSKSDAEVVACL